MKQLLLGEIPKHYLFLCGHCRTSGKDFIDDSESFTPMAIMLIEVDLGSCLGCWLWRGAPGHPSTLIHLPVAAAGREQVVVAGQQDSLLSEWGKRQEGEGSIRWERDIQHGKGQAHGGKNPLLSGCSLEQLSRREFFLWEFKISPPFSSDIPPPISLLSWKPSAVEGELLEGRENGGGAHVVGLSMVQNSLALVLFTPLYSLQRNNLFLPSSLC